ncbi:exported hypothetical protein [Candidatus Zixiibacteriota bacterium]|nr:exported hypothetical protein [candidate division Zixibacteria bacterium]
MKKIFFIFGGLIWILASLAPAQEAGSKISVQAGISFFPNPADSPKVLVEFPFAVNRNDFAFMPIDSQVSGVRAAIYAEIIVTDTLGKPVDSSSTYFYTMAPDTVSARMSKIRLFNKLLLDLEPGIYKGKLNVIDVTSKRNGAMLYDRIEVPAVVKDRLSLSSLELAIQIRVVDESYKGNPRLVKNDREVIPNPMGIFSEEDTLLYTYAELYGLAYDSARKDQFKINYLITQAGVPALNDSNGYRHDFGDIAMDKPGPSAVLTNVLPFRGNPGRYDIALTATDVESGETVTATRRFIVVPKTGYQPPAVVYRMKSPLDTASITTISNLVHYLLSPSELAVFNSLNDSGKIRYAGQFFRDHDPTPGTGENEYLNQAFARYDYALEHFSNDPEVKSGWRSDRGRVLMQYGFWDQRDEEIVPEKELGPIIENTNTKTRIAPIMGRPWERWYYRNIQSGILFIFEDVSGFGDFRLVHSTATGEIYNKEWDTYIKDHNLEIY